MRSAAAAGIGPCRGKSGAAPQRGARNAAAAAAAAPPTPTRHPQQQHQRQHRPRLITAAAAAPSSGGSGGEASGDLTGLFTQELARREAEAARAAEAGAAAGFTGAELLALVRGKYGRSYDLSLVQRQYMGKHFVAVNVMWKYKEQASFGLSDEEYAARLDYIAAALVAWGAVGSVRSQLAATKERPRVGKAVSLFIEGVSPERAAEWFG